MLAWFQAATPEPGLFKMLEKHPRPSFDLMLLGFILQRCQWQQCVCCETGCGSVDSCYRVSYSKLRSSTVEDHSSESVCGWNGYITTPECENKVNYMVFCNWVSGGNMLWLVMDTVSELIFDICMFSQSRLLCKHYNAVSVSREVHSYIIKILNSIRNHLRKYYYFTILCYK